jgi:hypothetical protein
MNARPTRITALLLALLLAAWPAAADLSPELQKALTDSKYVYISSTRKDGSFGKPAEIWFLFHDGAVYVGTPPTSWRVRRIKAGRPGAKIAVGKPDGPVLLAVGSVVDDPSIQELMIKTYARKYETAWQTHEESFRQGFKNGGRVVVRYVPRNQ